MPIIQLLMGLQSPNFPVTYLILFILRINCKVDHFLNIGDLKVI